ncbi:MAG TPA: hypothetical protein VGM86_15435 [Thermoanaerobaculia bacterium]|jgi:hypothetical protein
MKVFIGWSGPLSRSVAYVLHEKLPYIIPAIVPFVSSEDISKGELWSNTLEKNLREADFGIVCITPFNVKSPWLNFEAGVLSEPVRRNRLAPFLFGVDRAQLRGGPLERLQVTVYEKSDVFILLRSMNNKLSVENQVNYDHLKIAFESWWPELAAALEGVVAQSGETETGFKWLYAIDDLKRIVKDLTGKCIMVVSLYPERDFNLFFVKEMVNRNLERGVSYAILIAESAVPAGRRVIESAFSLHPDKLCLVPVPDCVFDPAAITHCCLLNYECGDLDLRVFLELPVEEQAYSIEQTFWIEVTEFAARRFAQRFRDMKDKYACLPRPPVAASSDLRTSP